MKALGKSPLLIRLLKSKSWSSVVNSLAKSSPSRFLPILEKTPLNQLCTPQDIAQCVYFLSTESNFINGECVKVDGGRNLYS